jgi:acyl carrier protein
MTSPVFERVRGIAADVLKVSGSAITAETSLESIEAWDSLQHLNLILALEQEFGVQFEPEEIDQMNRIDRILVVVQGKIDHAAQ